MGASSFTPTIELPQFGDNDKPNWLGDVNGAFLDIDTAISDAVADIASNTADILTKSNKDSTVVVATEHGVVNDGVTDTTTTFNALLTAFAGRTIRLPAGVYLIDAAANVGVGAQPVGIVMSTPNTHLVLDPGATLKVKPNAETHYSLIQVTAADCSVSGGRILGDVGTHTGSTGEWGHGVDINVGADRFRLSNIYISRCWGDGVVVYGGNNCVIDGVISDSNRRQGLSVINCDKLIVTRSAFINTGTVAYTGPAAGIDVEPNAGIGNVTGLSISDVILSGNVGEGLLSSSNGQTLNGQIVNAQAISNGNGTIKLPGFYMAGATNGLRLVGCRSTGNGLDGFLADAATVGMRMVGCSARANLRHGFTIVGIGAKLHACTADENNQTGFYVDPASTFASLIACYAKANSQQTTSTYQNFDIQGADARVMSCLADAGTLTNKPNNAFIVRTTGLRARIIGCDAQGAHTSNFTDQTNASYVDNIIGAPVGNVTVAALAAAGAGAPAPVVSTTRGRNAKGSFTFGSGTTPTVNNILTVTFSSAYQVAPFVQIFERNLATKALGLYVSAVTTTDFTIATTTALTASQAATVYSLDYVVS